MFVGAGEALVGGLLAGDDGHREHSFRELTIDFEHLQCLGHGIVTVGVRGVPLLPEKFRGAQEEARAHLPAHDVGPLVDEQRQVAIALDPALERVADNRLRRRPHDERLLQLGFGIDDELAAFVLQAVVRDDRHLLGEAFDVLSLLGDEAHRDEEWEVAVVVARFLDAGIELRLNALPNAPAPRLDYHAAAHRARLGHVAVAHGGLVPLGEVLLASDR